METGDTTWGVPSSHRQNKQVPVYSDLLNAKLSRSKTLQNELQTNQIIHDLLQYTSSRAHNLPPTSDMKGFQDQSNSLFEPFDVLELMSSSNAGSFHEQICTQDLLKDKHNKNGITTTEGKFYEFDDTRVELTVEMPRSVLVDLENERAVIEGGEASSLLLLTRDNQLRFSNCSTQINEVMDTPKAIGTEIEKRDDEANGIKVDSVQIELENREIIPEAIVNGNSKEEYSLLITTNVDQLSSCSTQIVIEKEVANLNNPVPMADGLKEKKVRKKRRKPTTTGDLIYTEGVPKGRRNRRLRGFFVDMDEPHEKPVLLPLSPFEGSHFLKEVSDSDIELGCSLISSNERRLTANTSVCDGKQDESTQHNIVDALSSRSQLNLSSTQVVADDLSHVENVIESKCDDDSKITDEIARPSPILDDTEKVSDEISSLPTLMVSNSTKIRRKQAKSLAEICASTSNSFFKPRVGLSRRANIESLHSYLKKK